MKEKNIHEKWGTIVEFDRPSDFFNVEPDKWRRMIYERGLIVFKRMSFSKVDYANFCEAFGKPWTAEDYKYSKESVEIVNVDGVDKVISPISNLISKKLAQHNMPWHADIPNKFENPFPIRSIWMVSNPNPDSGLTSWLNIEEGLKLLPDDLKNQIPDIKIVQQSWYSKGTDIQVFPFIKKHPVSGKESLRLNFFCDKEKNITDAWIRNVIYKDNLEEPGTILKPFYKFLESKQELLYTHKWDDFDIVIYDNWPFVHNRTKLVFDPILERKLYRANIDHHLPI